MVTCSALESEYGRYAQHFAVAVVSFAVHQKAPHPYAESMSVFAGAGKPRLKFSYPESWECEAVESSTPDRTGVNVNLVSRDKNNQLVTVYGCIHARAYAKTAGKSPEEILAGLKSDFEKDMFHILQPNQLKGRSHARANGAIGKTGALGRERKGNSRRSGLSGAAVRI